ncbi:hypothetical protein [Bosea sp. (in: a-proteobacteria)]|jgi:hypothetical protein|uniref:hypothetical protein n=1 Tax=Bosea sp. (in: a-proteobacteria) TaxID=1871050 RepID=UPI001AC4EEFF|nr:hypothetical protein [Bosea sp. (in: a-proteobacteria)]MBN9437780.1 hypothetical protein [Bosea sp. (in: a-proteobacteria)]
MSTASPIQASKLADESFMSADDLRSYMAELDMAKASKLLGAMDRAEEARKKLVATLQEEIAVTPEKIAEIKHSLATKTRAAAERGEKEVLVMRFPSALCSDRGRAINNAEADWPTTLTGRPRQAYEFWQEHLRPAKYKLRAMIIDWPGGMPGDVAFFLSWS